MLLQARTMPWRLFSEGGERGGKETMPGLKLGRKALTEVSQKENKIITAKEANLLANEVITQKRKKVEQGDKFTGVVSLIKSAAEAGEFAISKQFLLKENKEIEEIGVIASLLEDRGYVMTMNQTRNSDSTITINLTIKWRGW